MNHSDVLATGGNFLLWKRKSSRLPTRAGGCPWRI